MKRLAFILLPCATILVFCATGLMAQESEGAKSGEDTLILWKWGNFAILTVIAGYFINKHAPGLFHARSTEIKKGIAEAQQVKRDAEKRAADMDARMSRLGADIDAFRSEAKADMDREGERIQRETVAQVDKLHQQSALEIDTAGKTARRELREYAADLALDLAGQRISTRLAPATEADLFARFLKDLERRHLAGEGSKN